MQYGRKKYGYGGSVDKLRMAFGGKMVYGEQGVKVEQGDPNNGKISHGVVTGNSEFRVLPVAVNPERPDSPIKNVFLIDGREVQPNEFAAALPEGANINQMIEKGTKDAGLTYNKAEGKWKYTAKMSGETRKAMAERKAYEMGGENAVIDLYNQRIDAANEAYRMRGGGTGPDLPGSYTPQPRIPYRNQ